jgi:hypothetical protein
MAEAKHFRLLGAWLDLKENGCWLAFYSILHELAIDLFTGPTISPLDERKQQKHRSNQVNLARPKQAAEAKRNYHFVVAPLGSTAGLARMGSTGDSGLECGQELLSRTFWEFLSDQCSGWVFVT